MSGGEPGRSSTELQTASSDEERESTSWRAALRGELEGLHPFDPREQEHRAAILELLALPGEVASRDHYEPGHLTASAFVLSPNGNALLLIHHAKLDRWLQPGGHVDLADESLLHAALREVREETGLDRVDVLRWPFDVDVHEIPARGAAPAHRHYDVRALLRSSTWDVQGASDALAARWFPWSELTEQLTDDSVLRAVRKIQARASMADGLG